MLRKLLTCLALLTGLAAAGVPAQAEVAAALASRIEASAVSEATARTTATTAGRALPRATKPGKAASPRAIFRRLIRTPSVYLGSDRARE